mmetsp:Transcript_5183/g.5938  ORF Transcript_5183/g.5938 Transcript_5183/m.5938 type:complete len:237 (+) Transcript_5183:173-883(+)
MSWVTQILRCRGSLVEAVGGSHGALQVERAHVLPVLLQKRHKEVDGLLHVLEELLVRVVDGADGDGEAQHLLHLELDSATDVEHLLLQRLVVGNESGELASLVETGSEQTGDLADHGLRGKEGVVLASQLLHELLVPVEGLEHLDITEVETELLGLVAVDLVTEDAELYTRLAGLGEPDGATETLVALGIVVLEADLKLDGLHEATLLGFHRVLQHSLNDIAEMLRRKLAAHGAGR